MADAVTAFWNRLGLAVTPQRAGFAARVLAAGRRNAPRRLTLVDRNGKEREVVLQNLYALPEQARAPLTVTRVPRRTTVRFNNSLGERDTIAAFDEALLATPLADAIVLDLRDTPSGGNTTVARAIMGWFVDRPRGYQVHNSPAELRATGIARQWIEQVLPRAGKHRPTLPEVLVGHWTGSMGEGLAVGFDALGARVAGTAMAGLNGSVETLAVGDSGLTIQLPTERLMTVAGTPREDWVPRRR